MKKKTHKEFIREMYKKYKCDFSVLSLYKNAKAKVTVKCNKCGNVYETVPSNILHGFGCRECHKIKLHNLKKMSDKEFNRRMKDKHPDSDLISKYINARTNVTIRNNKCGHIFEATPFSYLNRDIHCPKCGRIGLWSKSNEKFLLDLKQANKNIEPLEEYTRSTVHMRVKNILCGHEWSATPANLLKGHDCPICKFSKGEKAIYEILSESVHDFETQKKFKTCKYKSYLRFDFYIESLNLCIEFNGRQHYEPVEIFGGVEGFKETCNRDNAKTLWCQENGKQLLIIRHDESVVSRLKEFI